MNFALAVGAPPHPMPRHMRTDDEARKRKPEPPCICPICGVDMWREPHRFPCLNVKP
jgi:hypothetical protein